MVSTQPIVEAELLQAFAAFADTLNFTAAARRVGLSQPALFERVRRLGELCEAPLYVREGRTLRLTPAGVQAAAFARESQERSRAFLRALRAEPSAETVTLAAGEGSYLYLLGPAIARFAGEGAVVLRLLTLGAARATEAVLSGEAHLGVSVLDLVPPKLSAVDLARVPLSAAMARSHPLARRRRLRVTDLAGERLILPPEGRAHRDFVGRALSQLGRDVAPPIEADGWPLMLAFTRLGLGIAIVNGICELPKGVVARPLPELGTVCYRLIRRRGARLSAEAERLAEAIVAYAPAPARRERTA